MSEGPPAEIAPVEPPPVEPVVAGERIESVDVLRGVAVLGILLMNIYAFALPWPVYSNPLRGGGATPLDLGTWWFTHLAAEMKFMTIFSMLFGAGLALMAERAEARGARPGGVYYRRLLWLAVFGAVHGYLLWFGDILYWYAVCGVVLYPLRRLRPATLLVLGGALLAVSLPLGLGFGYGALPAMKAEARAAIEARDAGEHLSDDQERAIEAWESFYPTDDDIREEVEIFRNGYPAQVAFRAPLVLQFQTAFLLLFGIWRIGGLMLAGMALMKLGVFSARRSTRFYVVCCLAGYGLGLPVVYLGARALIERQFDFFFLNQVGYFPNYFASIPVALGHVGAVMLLWRSGLLPGLTRRLAAVGRMALTSYLSHTVILTTLFYGWGLGLFDRVGRFGLMGFVLAVWLFQLWISPVWLRRFRFGPAEWLWRSLTYRRRQPMRVAADAAG